MGSSRVLLRFVAVLCGSICAKMLPSKARQEAMPSTPASQVVDRSEIFISYSRRDAEFIGRLTAALEKERLDFWFDGKGLGGDRVDSVIRTQLAHAKAVIVVWSPTSIESEYVKGEARDGLRRNIAVPILIGGVSTFDPPHDFHSINSIDFSGWQHDREAACFIQLLRSLERLSVRPAEQVPDCASKPRTISIKTAPSRNSRPWIVLLSLLALISAAAWMHWVSDTELDGGLMTSTVRHAPPKTPSIAGRPMKALDSSSSTTATSTSDIRMPFQVRSRSRGPTTRKTAMSQEVLNE